MLLSKDSKRSWCDQAPAHPSALVTFRENTLSNLPSLSSSLQAAFQWGELSPSAPPAINNDSKGKGGNDKQIERSWN